MSLVRMSLASLSLARMSRSLFPLLRMNALPARRIAVSMGLLGGALAVAALATGCARSTEPTADQFAAGLKDYLAQRGDLCLAKTDWPIDLTQHEIDSGARNALQLPVLERLQLVSSTVAEVDVKDDNEVLHHMKVRRYALTDSGKQFFITREQPRAGGGKERRGDFCAAKLSLDKVVRWDLTGTGQDRVAVVSYTYQVQAAPWTGDAELRKVFPVVANVIQGAGSAQLQESFRQTPTGWVAVDLL